MLKLTLTQDEYLTIGDGIVIQLTDVGGRHAELTIYADRGIPIVRGEVLEQQGGKRPVCLDRPPRKK